MIHKSATHHAAVGRSSPTLVTPALWESKLQGSAMFVGRIASETIKLRRSGMAQTLRGDRVPNHHAAPLELGWLIGGGVATDMALPTELLRYQPSPLGPNLAAEDSRIILPLFLRKS